MGSKTAIGWTNSTWNPIWGCTKISPGCQHCYAVDVAAAGRVRQMPEVYQGLAIIDKYGQAQWTGKVHMIEAHLLDPLKWKNPRRIFVNSMSDLFHESLGFDLVDEIVYVMQKANWHQYQVLTKRADRLAAYYRSSPTRMELIRRNRHIWWGVSIEDPHWADERIPYLLAVDCMVRWLSAEPLLGPITILRYVKHEYSFGKDGLCEFCEQSQYGNPMHLKDAVSPLHWVVAGGESGPKARPMNPQWARGLLRECREAGIPYFFKQWGEYAPLGVNEKCDNRVHMRSPEERVARRHVFEDGTEVHRVGKLDAGNTLDGKTIEEYPEVLA